jgi:hypothetical protein
MFYLKIGEQVTMKSQYISTKSDGVSSKDSKTL